MPLVRGQAHIVFEYLKKATLSPVAGFAVVSLAILFGQPITARGQVIERDTLFLISANQDTVYFNLEGLLSADNSFTYPSAQSFEPFRFLKLTNVDTAILRNARWIFNGRKNWYDIQSITNEVFDGALTPKEKSLALWKFLRDNRIHRYPPDSGDEINDPVKFLGAYGYGLCYNVNFTNAFIAQNIGGVYHSFSNRNGRHFVSEINFDSTYSIIDSDLETFYTLYDNKTLAGFDDLVKDKDLIRRVHHFGKDQSYNQMNAFIAESVYMPNERVFNFGYKKTFHSLDFSLRPGESIFIDSEPGQEYHQLGNGDVTLPEVANGSFEYNVKFTNAPIGLLVDTISNVKVDTLDDARLRLMSKQPGQSSSFMIKMRSPFPIVDGSITGGFAAAFGDTVEVSFSRDSIDWINVWSADSTISGQVTMPLLDFIAPRSSDALYSYFIKFDFLNRADSITVFFDSLTLVSKFQISRHFLPDLLLGENSIHYRSTSNTKAEFQIGWREAHEVNVPPAVTEPIFPSDGANLDRLRFQFSWPAPASDLDSLSQIIDYEFQLSDRSDMKYPLSPSFEIYTRRVSDSLNTFAIPYDGLLTPGTTYYWRVRAKNRMGYWGAWSSVWSFVPHGPMAPTQIETRISQKDALEPSLVISWKSDSTGTVPTHYELHASNEALGFSPTTLTVVMDSIIESSIEIPYKPDSMFYFFRLVAIDQSGARSGPTSVFTLPSQFKIRLSDTVDIETPLALDLNWTNATIKDMIQLFPGYHLSYWLDQSIESKILEIPSWVQLDTAARAIFGRPSYGEFAKYRQNQLDSMSVRFYNAGVGIDFTVTFLMPVKSPANHPPVLNQNAIATYARNNFNSICSFEDPDQSLGDSIYSVRVENAPEWLSYSYQPGDTLLYLSGIPPLAGTDSLYVTAFDLQGDSSRSLLYLEVMDTLPISILGLSETLLWEGSINYSKVVTSFDRLKLGKRYELIEAPHWMRLDSLTGDMISSPDVGNSGEVEIVVRVIDEDGNEDVESFRIQVFPKPVASLQISTQEICKGDLVVATVSLDTQMVWSFAVETNGVVDTVQNLTESNFTFSLQPEDKTTIRLLSAWNNAMQFTAEGTAEVQVSSITLAQLPDVEILVGDSIHFAVLRKIGECSRITELSIQSGPSWLKLDDRVGELAGRAFHEDIGTSVVAIKLLDVESGKYEVEEFVVVVKPRMAKVQYIENREIWEGDTLRLMTPVVSLDDLAFEVALRTDSQWLTIDQKSGEITGTPGENDVGLSNVEVVVNSIDGRRDSTSFTILVKPLPRAVISDFRQIVCMNEITPVRVSLTGLPPWEIRYRMDTTEFHLTNILTAVVDIPVKVRKTSDFQLMEVYDKMVKGKVVSGLASFEVPVLPMMISPNPTSGIFDVSVDVCETSEFTARIVDTQGREVLHSVHLLSPGMHTLQFQFPEHYLGGVYLFSGLIKGRINSFREDSRLVLIR